MVTAYVGVGGEVAVADGGADPQAAVRGADHPVQGQLGDVDEKARFLDAEFHEVDEVGPAAQEAGSGALRAEPYGFGGGGGSLIAERFHGVTSSMASTIRG